jgi:hypothetical protein
VEMVKNPEQMDPYGFHEMLVRLGNKYLPQRHDVPQFMRAFDRDAYYTRILCDEFAPKMWQVPVDISGFDLRRISGEGTILDLLGPRFEMAFQALRYVIDEDWNSQVLPAETPGGE